MLASYWTINIPMVADVMESRSTHYKCYWNTFKQGNSQLKYKSKILMVLHNHDCGKVDISITIMKTTSRLFSQSQKSPSPSHIGSTIMKVEAAVMGSKELGLPDL